jgi:hypothetical protein
MYPGVLYSRKSIGQECLEMSTPYDLFDPPGALKEVSAAGRVKLSI